MSDKKKKTWNPRLNKRDAEKLAEDNKVVDLNRERRLRGKLIDDGIIVNRGFNTKEPESVLPTARYPFSESEEAAGWGAV